MTVMRLKCRVRTLLIGVAALAVIFAWVAIDRRSKRFNDLAVHHLQAHEILVDQAGGPLDCLQVSDDETWETAAEERFAARGEREHLAYKASRYHWELFEKYRRAAVHPWLWVVADSPPPQMANPRFIPDASYDQMVRDWDKPPSGGFQ